MRLALEPLATLLKHVLGYLFHPDVGVFRLIVNGQPVDDPIIGFAAIPGALVIMLISGILAVLLFFGVGIIMFFIALFFTMLGFFLIAPFFWPVLVIIFLMIALLSVSGSRL
ncbi:MAG: hypothetical protein ACXWTS_08220 [Methylococcaceae bacterium]